MMTSCRVLFVILSAHIAALSVVKANVQLEMGKTDCGGDTHEVTDDEGYLASYSDPDTNKYQPNCEWTVRIRTASGHPISYKFNRLTLAPGDELDIYDNISYSKHWVQGTLIPSGYVDLPSKSFSVTFTSDDNIESTGFKITWRHNLPEVLITTTFPDDAEHRNVIAGTHVFVQSPNYPENYDPNTSKHWLLYAPTGKRVIFIFQYFKTDVSDKLRIYSGQDRLTEELIGEYSANLNRKLPPPLISTTNFIHLWFQSDHYLNDRGFSIEYYIYETSADPATTTAPAKKKLDPAVTAVIVILLVLFISMACAALFYFFYYKPKKDAELAEQAALFVNKAAGYTDDLGVVINPSARPGTSYGRPGTSAGRPGTSYGRPGTSVGHPGTSAGRPGTSGGRPGTSTGRPGTSSGRPGTSVGNSEIFPVDRPGTSTGRPGSSSQRPNSALRPDSGHLKVPSDRPGTALRGGSDDEERIVKKSKMPLAAIVGINRQPTLIALESASMRTPQIFINNGYNNSEEDVLFQRPTGVSGTNPNRLPPLGGKLPPIGGASSLPPLQVRNTQVQKLQGDSTHLASDSDSDLET